MDTTTVLEIIKMLDVEITNAWQNAQDTCEFDTPSDGEMPDYMKEVGRACALEDFRDHLQDYIEARVSAMENSTPE